jgi:hypothetical protein
MKVSLHHMPDISKNASQSRIARAGLPTHPEPLSGLESDLISKLAMTPTNAPSRESPIGQRLETERLPLTRSRTMAHARPRLGGPSGFNWTLDCTNRARCGRYLVKPGASPCRFSVRYAFTIYNLIESILCKYLSRLLPVFSVPARPR